MAKVSKRIFAYIIDMFLVLILSTLLVSIIPQSSEYKEVNKEFNNVINEMFLNENFSEEAIENQTNKLSDITYDLNKVSVVSNLVIVVLYFVYFVVLECYNKGQTLGKRLMKIRVVSENDDDANFKQILLRGIIIYPMLYDLLKSLLILVVNKSTYLSLSEIISMTNTILLVICFITMIANSKGLHDRVARTKVIDDILDNEDKKISTWEKNSKAKKTNKNKNKKVSERVKNHVVSKEDK